MREYFLICIFLASFVPSFAQAGQLSREDELALTRYEDSLGMLAHIIVNDSLELNRLVAVRTFIPQLVRALKHKHSFNYPFKQLRPYISFLYPPDSTFRIITWQVASGADFRNFGAIQFNTDTLRLIPLIDRSETYAFPQVEHVQLTPKEWFGAIYYRLMPLKKGKKTYYLLFGFDNFNPLTRRKVLDVLSFENGRPVFGAPVIEFPKKNETKHRLILEYYSGAMTSLNYDPERNLILYDHLISTKDKDGNVLRVPDGSYEAFEIRKGRLRHIDKVFHQTQEKPPIPFPILNGDRDIFGKKKAKH